MVYHSWCTTGRDAGDGGAGGTVADQRMEHAEHSAHSVLCSCEVGGVNDLGGAAPGTRSMLSIPSPSGWL